MQSAYAALAFRLVAVWLLFCRLGASESSLRGASSFGIAPALRLHQRGASCLQFPFPDGLDMMAIGAWM